MEKIDKKDKNHLHLVDWSGKRPTPGGSAGQVKQPTEAKRTGWFTARPPESVPFVA